MQASDADFEKVVSQCGGPVLVDFWASWCPPCKAMEPLLDRLRSEMAGRVSIVGLNIDRNPQVSAKYKIDNVPTFLLFRSGREIARKSGAVTERQLRELIAAGDEPQSALQESAAAEDWIAVVSGLPRSGTSMMMQMLDAGGIKAYSDGLRAADEDNPNGYFELEAVKQLADNASWLAGARGRAVKVIYKLLPSLPPGFPYRVVFMRRDMQEILASQRAMLLRRGAPADAAGDPHMARLFDQELTQIRKWIAAQPNIASIEVNYNAVLQNSRQELERLNQFFGAKMHAPSMAAVIDQRLYRQRVA